MYTLCCRTESGWRFSPIGKNLSKKHSGRTALSQTQPTSQGSEKSRRRGASSGLLLTCTYAESACAQMAWSDQVQ